MASVDKIHVEAAIKAVQMRKARYATFKVFKSDEQIQIQVAKVSERKDITYKQFLKEFNDMQPLYACYDYEHLSSDGRPTSTLLFIYWCPENANTNDRILYSSAKSNLVSMLSGYQLRSFEEIEEVKEQLRDEHQIM